MTAKALLIDPTTGDLDISQHRLRLTSDRSTYVAQRIEQRLKLFLAEWYLNVRKGVPYFRDILIKNPDLGLVQSILSTVILTTNGVAQVTKYEQTIDTSTRALTVVFSCTLVTGEIIANRSVSIPF